eukprot:TRINITY_DN3593_c0_g1_i22.p1 TRINITY_DN3593_c0_g1~~TRINITY_DN3593_c0_g1_i22.p1  ORF type:complete len:146 (+),score=13.55 TRINITY_DN3593_c0_g1_i22:631-1068(+)
MIGEFSFALPHEIRCISWSQCTCEPPMLAVGCAEKSGEGEELLQIWLEKSNEQSQLNFISSGVGSVANYKKAITAVAWAPFIGKSYNTLAVASEDQQLTLWKVRGKVSESNDWDALNLETFCSIALNSTVFLCPVLSQCISPGTL